MGVSNRATDRSRSNVCRNSFPVSPRGELWPAGLRREPASATTTTAGARRATIKRR